jgi:DNA-binding transcriptional MocR family regulator
MLRYSAKELATIVGRWSAGQGPLYHRLAVALRRLIEQGQLRPEALLPPERTLARALAVSRNTVAAAYELLRAEGLIERRQGSGTTVAPRRYSPSGEYKANAMFLSLLEGSTATIDLTCAVNETSPLVRELLADPATWDAGALDGSGYQPAGLPALREAVAAHLTRRSLPTTAEQVLITTGAQQALSLLARVLLRQGDLVITEEFTFPGALDAVEAVGATVATVPLTRRGADLDALERALCVQRPRLVYLQPSFHNPVGVLMPPDARRRLADLAAAHNVPVVDDAVLGDLGHGSPVPPPVACYRPDAPVVLVGSLSKLFWGGLRIGWLRAPSPMVSFLARAKAVEDLGGGTLSQALAVRLLERIDEVVSWRNLQLRGRLDRVEAAIRAAGAGWEWDRPPGGQSLWIRLPGADASAFAQVAIRHGVSVIPGPLVSPNGAGGDRFRLPFVADPEVLETAVELLARAWRSFRLRSA